MRRRGCSEPPSTPPISHKHRRRLESSENRLRCGVLWVFSKNGRQLRCEVMHAAAARRYRIVVTRSDRTESSEEVDATAIAERTAAVMSGLRDEGWQLC